MFFTFRACHTYSNKFFGNQILWLNRFRLFRNIWIKILCVIRRKSTLSAPGTEARGRASQSRSWQGRGMLRVNTERRFFPDLKIGVWRRRTYQLNPFVSSGILDWPGRDVKPGNAFGPSPSPFSSGGVRSSAHGRGSVCRGPSGPRCRRARGCSSGTTRPWPGRRGSFP